MLNKHKVAIVGYGWLGKALAKRLIEHGFSVYSGTSSINEVQKTDGLTLFPFLFHENVLSVADEFWDSSTLIVCVPPSSDKTAYPQLINNLRQQAKFHNINTLLFTSSTSVYEDFEKEVTEESAELIEGILVESERSVLQSDFKFRYVLRLAGLIGPDRHPGNFMSAKTNISKPMAPVNLIQLDEITDTISKIIEKDIPSGIYNICSTEHPSRKDYYCEMTGSLGKILPQFDEMDFKKGKIISSQKIRYLLPDIVCTSIYDFP